MFLQQPVSVYPTANLQQPVTSLNKKAKVDFLKI